MVVEAFVTAAVEPAVRLDESDAAAGAHVDDRARMRDGGGVSTFTRVVGCGDVNDVNRHVDPHAGVDDDHGTVVAVGVVAGEEPIDRPIDAGQRNIRDGPAVRQIGEPAPQAGRDVVVVGEVGVVDAVHEHEAWSAVVAGERADNLA